MTESPIQLTDTEQPISANKRAKLASIARRLQAISVELDALVQELQESTEQNLIKQSLPDDLQQYISDLKILGRDSASDKLKQWKQPDLAKLYLHLGGPSRDKKRSKEWIIERILWQVFDFQSGHEILKDTGS